MLGDTLKKAEAHLKVMKQHEKDQVAAFSRARATDAERRAEAQRLHKVYQDAHRLSRDSYAASYKAQQQAHAKSVVAAITGAATTTAPAKTTAAPVKTTAAPTKTTAAPTKTTVAAAKAAAESQADDAIAAALKSTAALTSSADAKAAAATAKAIPDSADIPVNGRHPNDSKDFASAVNAYKNRMSVLAKSLKPSTAKESKEQLKRDEAELFAIRDGLAKAQDSNNAHINTLQAHEAGAFTGPQLTSFKALDTEGKKQVGVAINAYTEARGALIKYDAANEANKKVPPVNFSGMTHTERRAELKRVAATHLKYLTWAAEHQRLYGELVKSRNAARASLKKQTDAATKGSTESTAAERGAATKAANKEKAAASVSVGGNN